MSYFNIKRPFEPNWIDYILIIVVILCLLTLIFVAMKTNAQIINPDDYNIPKNGSTDSVSYWEDLDANIVSGSTIVLPPGANYYINTSGGLTFTKTVHILGSGSKFTCGSSVGNNPTLIFTGNRTILENFEIDSTLNHTDGNDNDFMDSGDSLSNHNYRRGILIQGKYSTCRNLYTISCVIGIELNADYCTIDNCKFINTSIVSGSAQANNYYSFILF